MSKQADGKDLGQHIYHDVYSKIISLDLAPGHLFPDDWFEDTYKASRTPILAAIAHLMDNGLVERKLGRYYVSRINTSAIMELLYGRVALETEMICDLMSERRPMLYEDLNHFLNKQKIVACQENINAVLFHKFDSSFHERIYVEAHMMHVCAFFRDNLDYVRIKILDLKRKQAYGSIISDHQKILNDLDEHRRDVISRDLHEHIYSHIADFIESCKEGRRYFV